MIDDTATPADQVRVGVDGAVGRLTLSAPERLNAVAPDMLRAVARGIGRLDDDPAVRVIVLSGEGRAFSAGADLGVHVDEGDLDGTLFGVGAAVRAVLEAGTPVISLVPGVAAGAGLSLALSADYVLVADDATLVLAFGALGLMPDGGATALVAASVGRARALRLALSGERLTGATAAQWGLVSESVAREDFAARADELVAHLATLAPEGTALTTAAITAATLDLDATLGREESGQRALLRTPDFAEGLAAFRGKRPPTFGS
ncbi:enoyl-CoA hydratase/isomerase family protein [Knoellia aerolata]|uniref:Crotonase n=1 Tax=Knoellia aerolata DSM 18566 TaxID=1385519 RepID=A0A0A0JUE5_9MICO|nr:enoyl-CoA hydratase-related protein [Knoellia aerolata]KGN40334.1 crotonase [Knoellia aerolata DSM 18566]